MQNLNICLSDILESKITTGKNGKKYVNITVDTKRDTDQFGNDLTVFLSQTKDERLAKEPKAYVGSGKTFNFERQEQRPAYTPVMGAKETPPQEIRKEGDDDLPF